jgi:hypothetical protein
VRLAGRGVDPTAQEVVHHFSKARPSPTREVAKACHQVVIEREGRSHVGIIMPSAGFTRGPDFCRLRGPAASGAGSDCAGSPPRDYPRSLDLGFLARSADRGSLVTAAPKLGGPLPRPLRG